MPASKAPVVDHLRAAFSAEPNVAFEHKEGARIAVNKERFLCVRDAFADGSFHLEFWKTTAPVFARLQQRRIIEVPARERRYAVVWKSFRADAEGAKWLCEEAIRHELAGGSSRIPVEPTADPAHLQEQVAALLRAGDVPRPPPRSGPAPFVDAARKEFVRDPGVVAWVLRQAGGRCERCGLPAPFLRGDGTPYLEVHHVLRLADDGPDAVENAVALCPNCHRHLHHSVDAAQQVENLYGKVPRLVRHPARSGE